MQVGGIGSSGLNSHSGSHQVTGCIHEHHTKKEETGGMRASSSASSQITGMPETREQGMSLLDMLRNTIVGGKRLLGRLWGSETDGDAVLGTQKPVDGSETHTEGMNPVVAADRDDSHAVSHDARVAAASMAVQYPRAQMTDNPYFTTHSDPGKVQENPFVKVRIKFRDAAGQMARRFGGKLGERLAGRFAGKKPLNYRQRESKEDLRKRSRYKGVDEEIDCVLTDDSYLLDSYDRNGEYSKLTTENKR